MISSFPGLDVQKVEDSRRLAVADELVGIREDSKAVDVKAPDLGRGLRRPLRDQNRTVGADFDGVGIDNVSGNTPDQVYN